MSVDERRRVAIRVRHESGVAIRTGRSLGLTWKGDYEVAVQVSQYPVVNKTGRNRGGLTGAGARVAGLAWVRGSRRGRQETPVLELLDHLKCTVHRRHGEMPSERVVRPVIPAGTGVGRAAPIWPVVRRALGVESGEEYAQVGCGESVVPNAGYERQNTRRRSTHTCAFRRSGNKPRKCPTSQNDD